LWMLDGQILPCRPASAADSSQARQAHWCVTVGLPLSSCPSPAGLGVAVSAEWEAWPSGRCGRSGLAEWRFLPRCSRPQRARPLRMRTPWPARAKITGADDECCRGSNPVVPNRLDKKPFDENVEGLSYCGDKSCAVESAERHSRFSAITFLPALRRAVCSSSPSRRSCQLRTPRRGPPSRRI